MKKDFVMPILVLTVICLIVTGILAVANNFTEPVISAAKEQKADAAKLEVLPEAAGFEAVEIDGLPSTVTEAYKTTNNVGYIFMLTVPGYGGDIKMICAISEGGALIDGKTLEHSETTGIGSRIDSADFLDQFKGNDGEMNGVSAISGATISSSAYISGIRDAFAAFDMIKGARK